MSYPPPYGYGAPAQPYGYGAPGYPPPMMAAPMMGAPMMAAGYAAIPPPPAGFVIPQYSPGMYSYQQPYMRAQPFMVPYNLPPHLAAKMMQASAAFRMFDTNWSGQLDKKEWKRSLRYLNYYIPKGYGKHLFCATMSRR